MVGNEEHPGLTPRAIARIFDNAAELGANHEVRVSCYMVELYNGKLVDLFFKVQQRKLEKKDRARTAPKLETKKDKHGTVVIKNAVVFDAPTTEACMKLFDKGNKQRHVGATKMNAGSSRSHLIFGVLIENKDLNTKKTSVGKLSLVDLAGSERADKTGATAERLKEAQSINKSLSALGNVISALSTNAKFIPYRDNKLTQVMSDSLGGNAKTLMFVNTSPADYNADETQSSLVYASRVKLITNSAEKKSEGEEVHALNAIIKELVASGGSSALLDAQQSGGGGA